MMKIYSTILAAAITLQVNNTHCFYTSWFISILKYVLSTKLTWLLLISTYSKIGNICCAKFQIMMSILLVIEPVVFLADIRHEEWKTSLEIDISLLTLNLQIFVRRYKVSLGNVISFRKGSISFGQPFF